jgi:hypothetical protein
MNSVQSISAPDIKNVLGRPPWPDADKIDVVVSKKAAHALPLLYVAWPLSFELPKSQDTALAPNEAHVVESLFDIDECSGNSVLARRTGE